MRATVAEVKGASTPKVEQGERNRSLFEACMRQAPSCSTSDELIAFAREYSDTDCVEPLPETEIIKTALSAWGYEQRGENRFGRGREIRLGHDLVNELSEMPDAFVLWAKVQVEHWNRPEFILANAMAAALGWTLPRFRKARDFLAVKGLIERTHQGGRGPNDPPRYRVTV